MKRVARSVLLVSLFALTLAQPAAAQELTPEQQATVAAWRSLAELEAKHREGIFRAYGQSQQPVRERRAEAIEAIEAFERDERPALVQRLEAFEAKHGASNSAIMASFARVFGDLWNDSFRAARAGIPEDLGKPHNLWSSLRDGLKYLDQNKKDTAELMVGAVQRNYDNMDVVDPPYRPKEYKRLQEELRLALRFDPDNAAAPQLLAQVEEAMAGYADAYRAELAAKTWPGHVANFAGPGDPDELAASALKWFAQSPDWGAREEGREEPLAVSVQGEWRVLSRTLTGEPMQWGLPIALAVGRESEPEVAVVFGLTLRTREEVGVEKGPPWTGVAVGSQWRMLRENVPAGGGGSGGGIVGWLGGLCCCVAFLALAGGGGFLAYTTLSKQQAQTAAGAVAPAPGPTPPSAPGDGGANPPAAGAPPPPPQG